MDWDEFEARARRAIPSQLLKPKRCWIGVLSHEKDPQSEFEETDFVWMIGHTKIGVQKIQETYQKRHEGVDFNLIFKDVVVDTNDTMKSFLAPGGDIVLFVASLTAQSEPLRLMTPLPAPQPTEAVGDDAIRTPVKARTATPVKTPLVRRVKDEPRDENLPLARSSNMTPPMASIEATEDSIAVVKPEGASARTENVPTALQRPIDRMPEELQLQNHAAPATKPQLQPSTPVRSAPLITLTATPLRSPRVKNERRASPVFHHMDEDTQAQFDPEQYFKEPSPEHESQEIAAPTDHSIRRIISEQDPLMLEAGVQQSIKVLQTLRAKFLRQAEVSQDAASWAEAIVKLIPQAERKRTIVGVVGNTGAGKSSVINAMLDEERLVPTNCMRACTAVVTEMSWNASTDPYSKYRAEIEFISREDWQKELGVLLKEFLTETGTVSREVSDENSDAGIAWAKFHSVYPKRSRDSLSDCTVESLMAEKSLSVLGTTKKINTSLPQSFYTQLQRYVDSKEKVTKKSKDKDKAKKNFDTEYWPLIKVVKIYVKAPALSTGAVIVDLPGVHDSNAARAAVAQGYMKQCTGLWIVAPINRAVDDKAAKTLLGESFKRQLKYDGGFSSVTFICSKTDDISITEAIDTLELEDEVEDLYDQERQYEKEIEDVKDQIQALKDSQDAYRMAQREATTEMEEWEKLQDLLDDGKEAYALVPTNNKRKKSDSKQKDTRKKRQNDHDDSDEEFVVSDDEDASSQSESDSDSEGIQAPRRQVTMDEVKAKIKELKGTKKNARREITEYRLKMEELAPRNRELKSKIAEIKAEINHICIAGRNDYSKRAIQQDFAAGIKELDQENAAEEDEDNFDPDEEMRDYDEVARSLPVFCVSSRAYQKMCGRLQKDDGPPGFKTPEETEMPQLQAHCKKLTEAGRMQTARTFLLSLCQQLTTFTLWASNDGTGLKMTDDDKRKQVKYLENRLKDLERGLEESVRSCLGVMKKELNEQIFNRYPDLIDEAVEVAPETASKWGAHRQEGGLAWGTYKAVVRRDGQYQSSSAGFRDFNADLVNPIVKKLATGWERAFSNRLPKAFEAFIKDSGKLLHNFHQAVEERARNNGVGLASLSALKTQIYTYEQLFADLNQILITRMTELQREANRDFTPTVAAIMHTVYDMCTTECGKGSFKRMKEHMKSQVDQNRHSMFNDATKTVKHHLDEMCKALEDVMDERADEIYVMMKADYMRVLGGVQINQAEVMPKEERALRAEIMDVLRGVDAQFKPIARGEFAAEPEQEQDEEDAVELIAIDEDDSAFESARESADQGDDSFMEDVNDTMITEPTPSKPGLQLEGSASSEKENRALLPTPSDDDADMEEDEL